jgi:hypothetical protein
MMANFCRLLAIESTLEDAEERRRKYLNFRPLEVTRKQLLFKTSENRSNLSENIPSRRPLTTPTAERSISYKMLRVVARHDRFGVELDQVDGAEDVDVEAENFALGIGAEG